MVVMARTRGLELLGFRCTQCGNCCRAPFLPVCDADVRRLQAHTGEAAADIVEWITPGDLETTVRDDGWVELTGGVYLMVLGKDHSGACRYLVDDRCSVHSARPTGCRRYPFDLDFSRRGEVKRVRLAISGECPYELDGQARLDDVEALHRLHSDEWGGYADRVAAWSTLQRARRRAGGRAPGADDFLHFMGLV